MNNDELQKAIDDITSSNVGAPVASTPVSDDATDENEQLVNEFGTPTVEAAAPAMSVVEQVAAELGEAPAAVVEEPVAPAEPVSIPEAPAMVMPEEPVVPAVETVAPAEPVVEEPVAAPANTTTDATNLEEVKKNALKELYPLLKNMNINPEQAYDICKQVAEMGEKDAILEAFEAAKKIGDDATRANALFEIVKMIEE